MTGVKSRARVYAMQNSVMRNQTTKPEKGPEDSESRYIVGSVKRALELLDVFLEPPHQYGLTELSVITSQTKNQVYRTLKTLQAHDVVVMDDESKKYRLGMRPMEWGVVAQVNALITQVAAPVMDRLSLEVGETIVLTMLADDTTAICIDKRESNQVLQISAKVGRRVPLHAGAGGKCLLAHSDDTFQESFILRADGLEKYTDLTITDPQALRDELETVRSLGYSVSDEDLDIGACSVAAPVFDAQGNVVATISVASPKTRFGTAEMERNSLAAMNAAMTVSKGLGYRL